MDTTTPGATSTEPASKGPEIYFTTLEDRLFFVRCLLRTTQQALTTTTSIDPDDADAIGYMVGFAGSVLDENDLATLNN